jgi:hypothetical protein
MRKIMAIIASILLGLSLPAHAQNGSDGFVLKFATYKNPQYENNDDLCTHILGANKSQLTDMQLYIDMSDVTTTSSGLPHVSSMVKAALDFLGKRPIKMNNMGLDGTFGYISDSASVGVGDGTYYLKYLSFEGKVKFQSPHEDEWNHFTGVLMISNAQDSKAVCEVIISTKG